jgi:hypothetical protein
MKEIGKFLVKFLGVVLIVLFALWVVSLIWNGVKTCPACPECPDVVTDQGLGTQTDNKVSVGGVELGEETICKFAEGYDAKGKVVPTGTVVTGPAFVKPDRNTDWGYPVYLTENYTTTASDEVVWLLVGDNACVDAQSLFFSIWSQTKP